MFLAAATRLDRRYEVISLLGTGGMGEVYLARDTKLDRRVALKLVSSTVAADSDRLRRFIGEAKAASALNHPNILVVHEIGDSGGRPFIVTEFIEGVTLRQRLADGPCSLAAALDVVVQVASALAAAHAAGIVHRDIKPENIMIRTDGVVKVLDFGLARTVVPGNNSATLITEPSGSADAATRTWDLTRPGLIVGTTRYMSPEQARGQEVDARSDVFSCGVVLYEMLAGESPFAGDTISDTIAALLTTDPPPLAQHLPDTPQELQRILDRALAKSREQRYPSANELWADAVALRRAVEFGAMERPPVPARVGEPDAVTRRRPEGWRHRGHLLNTLERHAFAGIAATVLLATAAVIFLSYSNRAAALTDKDTILIADFVNATGDPVFDAALKQGLAVHLSQSPFLSIFPETRVRETLRLIGRSPDDPVNPDVAREIGQRQALKAFIVGSIRKFERNYAITLEAVASLTGEPIALAQSEAVGKDDVLKALSRAANDLRERLGESLSTIAAFAAPLELTTSSLDALKAYALGEQEAQLGEYQSAIAFFQRAVELDPEFAYAWAKLAVQHMNTRQPARATEFATKAFALRHRMSERERLRMSSLYSGLVDGDADEALRVLERYRRTYPRDGLAPINLASGYIILGHFDRAITEARTALQLIPDNTSAVGDLAIALLASGNVTEANDVALQAVGRKIDSPDLRSILYFTAFLLGDDVLMQQQLDWARGRADEHVAFDWQAKTAAASGRRDAAEDFTRRAATLAVQTGAKELAARYTAEGALRAAAFGDCRRVGPAAQDALVLDRTHVQLTRSALALALCSRANAAQPLVDELKARYPKDTLVNTMWIPTIQAAIEVERGNGDRSMEFLAPIRFEGAGERWPQYVRARALTLQRNWGKARAELNELIADRGQVPLSPIGGLAYLRLAQMASEMGDIDEARNFYTRLFTYWSAADPKLPVLLRARAAYARLLQ